MKSEGLATLISKLKDNQRNTVVFDESTEMERVRFSDIYETVSLVSQQLRALGVDMGKQVAVIAENGKSAFIVDLALLNIDCTVLQIPEKNAKSALDVIGQDNIAYLLASALYEDVVESDSWEPLGKICGLSLFKNRAFLNASNAVPGPVIFSSGTSGKEKKIRVNNATVLPNAKQFFSAIGARQDDSFLIFLPLSNYQQKLLIYGCIDAGVDIVLSDMQQVMQALKRASPSLFLAPPLFYDAMWRLADGDEEKLRVAFGANMRQMWSGMAALPLAILTGYRAAGLPLLEAYGMTEYGPVAVNTLHHNRPGSVGRALTPGSVTLESDGEIRLKSSLRLTCGYVDQPAEVEQAVYLDETLIATGDVGHMDADGYIFIEGRKNDTIITSGGQKIHPTSVEQSFNSLPFVQHAVALGACRPHLGMLLIVEQIDSSARQLIESTISEYNIYASVPIRSYFLSTEPFTPENGLLTRNLKLQRKNISSRYETSVFS
ncbi:AMP-binding protein [Pseudomonas sp. EA_5y_Pfl2_R50]|uniref:AMP-binding protein n=1 Tax=Pseudomonas sp. EA_5y_Pfl2_R50 TaxID=3088691 RepID=UPI0030DC5A25